MNIYVYLDESGSIHKNSNQPYFVVGGYFTFLSDKNKITSTYKKINKKVKENNNFPINKELKAIHMHEEDKILFFKNIDNITYFYGVSKVFVKSLMKKEIIESNIFFNYAVKILFQDCILPILQLKKFKKPITFILSVDNRNVRVGDLKNLENYLKTEFCLESLNFSVTYYDSATNYGIELADLIVNTFYNYFKDREKVTKVIKILNLRKFCVSIFPGYLKIGRVKKISLDKIN